MTKEEVHNIAPDLKAASELKSPFNVPENYFDTIENQVVAQLSLKKTENSEPFNTPNDYFETVEDTVISKLKAKALNEAFENDDVPANYFDTLEDKVMDRLQLENKKTKVISLQNWKKLLLPIAAAASIILLLTIGNNQQQSLSFENLALSEIEYALDYNLMQYDSETLLEIFPEVEASLEDLDINLTEEDDLEDYLYDTDLSNILYE